MLILIQNKVKKNRKRDSNLFYLMRSLCIYYSTKQSRFLSIFLFNIRVYKELRNLSICSRKIECDYSWKSIKKTRSKRESKCIHLAHVIEKILTTHLTNYKVQTNCFTRRNSRHSVFAISWFEKKLLTKKIVVDIRDLNVVSQSDAYSISLQFDVLQTIQNRIYIFVVNYVDIFY